MPKNNFIVAGLAVLALTLLYAGFVFWQNFSLKSEIESLSNGLKVLKNESASFEQKEILQAINAKKGVDQLKKEDIKWSEVIDKIDETIPEKGGRPIVEVTSYSASVGSQISMNVRTNLIGENAYFDVADLIQAFNESEYFKETFVPSVSAARDAQGDDLLSFVLSTTYVKPKTN